MTPEVTFVFRRGRGERWPAVERGEAGSEYFYGMVGVGRRRSVGFVEEDGRAGRIARALWLPAEVAIARSFGIGFALHVPWAHRRALNATRAIVSTVDTCGLPLALLKRWGRVRPPLIYLSQGLSDRLRAFGTRRRLSRWLLGLLGEAEAIVVLSDGAREGLAELGVPRERIHVIPFGVDTEFWRATAPAGDGILSVGSDPSRDYATLLEACRGMPLHVVTSQRLPEGASVTTRHSTRELRDLYSRARFVVIPLKDVDQPSGQSASLQAMACGKAVVISRNRGFWAEGIALGGRDLVTVPPGDAGALREACERLLRDPKECDRIGAAARRLVEERFSERTMAEALDAVIAGVLAS